MSTAHPTPPTKPQPSPPEAPPVEAPQPTSPPQRPTGDTKHDDDVEAD